MNYQTSINKGQTSAQSFQVEAVPNLATLYSEMRENE